MVIISNVNVYIGIWDTCTSDRCIIFVVIIFIIHDIDRNVKWNRPRSIAVGMFEHILNNFNDSQCSYRCVYYTNIQVKLDIEFGISYRSYWRQMYWVWAYIIRILFFIIIYYDICKRSQMPSKHCIGMI
jgi:hypothetical protein